MKNVSFPFIVNSEIDEETPGRLTNKLLLGIEGMTCSSCTSTVTNALEGLIGVSHVAVSLTTNTATLEYDPTVVKSSTIVKEIEDVGFDVQILNDTISKSPAKKSQSQIKKVVLGIEGMTCSSCTGTVTSALSSIAGVSNVVVSLTTNSATFNYDPTLTNTKYIINEIESNGFDAQVLNEVVVSTAMGRNNSTSGLSPKKTPTRILLTKLLLGIDGMTCSSCTSTVESALRSLPSVRNVVVTLTTNTATLEFDPLVITSQKIIDEIEANGFGASIMSETAVSSAPSHLLTEKIPITSLVCDIVGNVDDNELEILIKNIHPSLRSYEIRKDKNQLVIEFNSQVLSRVTILENLNKSENPWHVKVLSEEIHDEMVEQTGNYDESNSNSNAVEELNSKSLLLNVLNDSISEEDLLTCQTALENMEGVYSVKYNAEDRHFILSFNELLVGPRNFLALGMSVNVFTQSSDISFAAMGGFMMANRLLKLQEKELKHLQFLLVISLLFTIPIVVLGMILPLDREQMMKISQEMAPGLTISDFIQLILVTPIQFYVGYRFHHKALATLKTKTVGMDFMISTGTFAAYFYSIITLIRNMVEASNNTSPMGMSKMANTYFDTSAVLITAIILGKYLEIYARGKTASAIHKLSNLRANQARLIGRMLREEMMNAPSSYLPLENDDCEAQKIDEHTPTASSKDSNDKEVLMDACYLHKYDVIRLVTGETIPADGVLLSGSRIAVDESLLTVRKTYF
jgi:Cu+-exporting ATPase